MVHPCREDYLLIVVSTVIDVQTYILILYNYKWILEICGSGIAFSQGVEEGSLCVNVTTCLIIINCYSLLFYMLQDAWSCLKMLVFDRLGLPLYSGILQFSPQIQPFHLIPCILSLDLMLASTLDEY